MTLGFMRNGFSLIECLVTITLISVLALMASAWPSHSARYKAHVQLSALTTQLNAARSQAVFSGVPVRMSQTGPWPVPQILWRGFGHADLEFSSLGGSRNGVFWYCPTPGYAGRGLIVSRAGRLRRTRDTNGDGLHEQPDGQGFVCP